MAKENPIVLKDSYLNELFENAQEAIVVVNRAGHVLRINREFTRLFGFSESEVIGKSVDSLLVPEEFKNKAYNITSMASKGENVVMDTVRRTKNGSLIDVSVLASPIESNGDIAAAFAGETSFSIRQPTFIRFWGTPRP